MKLPAILALNTLLENTHKNLRRAVIMNHLMARKRKMMKMMKMRKMRKLTLLQNVHLVGLV